MNKLLAFASLPFFSISLFKCTLASNEKDYAANYNPVEVLGSGSFSNNHVDINGYDYELRKGDNYDEISKLHDLIKAADYVSTSEINSDTDCFTYTVHKGAMIWGYSSYKYTFYNDGYVSIYKNNGKKDNDGNDLYSTYYYKCSDVKDAEAIYDYVNTIVEDYKEEQRQMKAEEEAANERVNTFTIESALNEIRNQDKLFLYFYCVDYNTEPDIRYSDPELEDDGSVKELILNTTYTPVSSSHSSSSNGRISHLSIGTPTKDENDNGTSLSWSMLFDEDDMDVSLSVKTTDKFARDYSKFYRYSISRADMHAIFDNAYRLYNAKHPVETNDPIESTSSR